MASSAPVATITNAATYKTEVAQQKQKKKQKQKEEANEMSESTYLDDAPHYDLKDMSPAGKEKFLKNSSSILSSSTLIPSPPFNPTKKLLIDAQGISLLRLPLPPKEMQIHITKPNKELVYMSGRLKRSSGNAVLTDKNGVALVTSEYLWGPGRDPTLRVLLSGKHIGEEVICVKGEWTSRKQHFLCEGGRDGFVWRYVREIDSATRKKATSLVMEVDASSSIEKEKEVGRSGIQRIAQLIRNEETRTPGTKSSSAGNGGELVVDEGVLGGMSIGEGVVVASCLMMLKKEIDRRRAVQMTMMSGGGS
jgi:hypothetical protein